MVWNSVAPIGTLSVKNNRLKIGDNFTYIELNMGNTAPDLPKTNLIKDHFWNVGDSFAGRHRYVNMPKFTVSGVEEDPLVGADMDGVFYLKEHAGTVQGYFKNNSGGLNSGIYQFVPGYLFGAAIVPSSSTYSTVVAVPPNTWGEIYMWTTALGRSSMVTGFFRSDASKVEAWSITNIRQGISPPDSAAALKFANGPDALGLNILARSQDASSGLAWNYRVMWRSP